MQCLLGYKEILALLKLFQNALAVSAVTVACEAKTRLVIKISSYACLLEKQAIKTVLKGRLKYIININRCKVGKREGRGAQRVCNSSALSLSTLPHTRSGMMHRSGTGVGRVSGDREEARGRQVEAKTTWDLWKWSRSGFDMWKQVLEKVEWVGMEQVWVGPSAA